MEKQVDNTRADSDRHMQPSIADDDGIIDDETKRRAARSKRDDTQAAVTAHSGLSQAVLLTILAASR